MSMSALPTPTITHCLMVSIDITHNVYKTFSAIGLTLRLVFSRDFNNAMLKKGTASATKALTNYLQGHSSGSPSADSQNRFILSLSCFQHPCLSHWTVLLNILREAADDFDPAVAFIGDLLTPIFSCVNELYELDAEDGQVCTSRSGARAHYKNGVTAPHVSV